MLFLSWILSILTKALVSNPGPIDNCTFLIRLSDNNDVTSKYLADLKRYCKTDKGGTDTKNITKVLQRYSKLKYQCVPFIKVQDLHNHIKNGGSAIVEISWFDKKKKETTGHYYAIVGILEYGNVVSYKAINWKIGFTQNFADRKAIVKEFRKCMKSEENPKAWLIEREND